MKLSKYWILLHLLRILPVATVATTEIMQTPPEPAAGLQFSSVDGQEIPDHFGLLDSEHLQTGRGGGDARMPLATSLKSRIIMT